MYGLNLLQVNPSPPTFIYIRQLLNVQSFDPSGSDLILHAKEREVNLSHEKKKNLYYG